MFIASDIVSTTSFALPLFATSSTATLAALSWSPFRISSVSCFDPSSPICACSSVVIEAPLRLPSQLSFLDHFLQKRCWCKRFAELGLKNLQRRQYNIYSDEVGELQWPHRMIRSQQKRLVDIITRRHLLLQELHAFIDKRHQSPVHNETSLIRGLDHSLPQRLHKRRCLLDCVWRRAFSLDQLHKLHRRDRIEKVQTQYLVRPFRSQRNLADTNRRRVRG